MTKNKKAQFGLVGLYDASNLPRWLLYPMVFLICIILLVVAIVMILFIVSWFRGDAQFMPFGFFGYYGMPIMMGSFQTEECYVDNVKVDCGFVEEYNICIGEKGEEHPWCEKYLT